MAIHISLGRIFLGLQESDLRYDLYDLRTKLQFTFHSNKPKMLGILKNRRNSISYTLDDEEQKSFTERTTETNRERQRRHTVSSDSSPVAAESKLPKSPSKLLSKLFSKTPDNVVDDYFNVSMYLGIYGIECVILPLFNDRLNNIY